MARKMRKFSDGGALGKYNRRMADIKKDFEKDSRGKSGKALEVLEAKRMQRTADAEDDRAKRIGTDRTATRAAERAAESNLTKTRKYGAPKAVTTEVPVAKITETLSVPKMDTSIGEKPAAAKPVQKPVQKAVVKKAEDKPKPSAADTARNKFFQDSLAKSDFKKTAKMAEAPIAPSKFDSKAFADLKAKVVAAKLAAMKKAAEAPGASRLVKDRYSDAVSSGMYAKGGKVKGKEKTMKYAKGGSTPPKPSAADRARSKKQLDSLKKAKTTPAEGKVIASANRSEGPGYKKGGSMASCGMKKGGKAKAKPFAATKFGAALKKKSADTKGRAMVKMASGGSVSKRADGCATKGKTKGKMLAMGGMAGYKRGGKTC